MSGAGENRWRRQGQANRQNHDRSSGTGTPTKDSGRQQAMPAPPGNAWGVKATAAGAAPATRNPTQTQATEQHAPVQDFNANEVKEFLRKKYLETTAGQSAVHHKVQGDSVPKRSSGAWGQGGKGMSHLMPSGQNFFTQLKKQLAGLDPNKPTP